MQPELKKLHGADTSRWLALALTNWMEIAAIYAAVAYFNHSLTWVIGWICLGTRMHALALLGHEGIHRNISKNKFVNNTLANIFCALPLQQTLTWFTKFHLDHHAGLGTDTDPELAFRERNKSRWSLPLTKSKRLKLLLLDLSGIGILESVNVLRHTFRELRLADILLPVFFWLMIWSIAWKLNVLWIPLFWAISHLTSYWAMFRQRALVEHLGTLDTHRINVSHLEKFFFLPHNCWYHYEHHKWQGIPCWNLPAAREFDKGIPVITTNVLFKELATSGNN